MSGGAPNAGYDYEEIVGPEAEGARLVEYLARRWRHTSAAEWERRIEAGLVLLDGRPARCDAPLAAGGRLLWRRPPWIEPEAPATFAILYRDDDLLAVAKPAGLPTLPGGGFLEKTLLARVRAVHPEAAPLHRLGRFTSGLVLFARRAEAAADLTRRFVTREVEKRYRALASGGPAHDRFTIEVPIGPVPYPPLGTIHAATSDGKPASTEVEVVERREGAFLCDVRIATGRAHQIRIHLAAAGHPLVGDPLWGPGGLPIAGTSALPGDPGYRLHAAELVFGHPRSGAPVRIVCAPPRELRRSARAAGV